MLEMETNAEIDTWIFREMQMVRGHLSGFRVEFFISLVKHVT